MITYLLSLRFGFLICWSGIHKVYQFYWDNVYDQTLEFIKPIDGLLSKSVDHCGISGSWNHHGSPPYCLSLPPVFKSDHRTKDGFSCKETCVHNRHTHICNYSEPPRRPVYNSVFLEQGKQCRVLIVVVIWNNKGK